MAYIIVGRAADYEEPVADIEMRNKVPGATALLIIDMINDLQFEEGSTMSSEALCAALTITKLRAAATKAGVPVVYVNDNFGLWHGDVASIVEHCLRPDSKGQQIVRKLRPRKRDYFVVKPHFSGFYATNLAALLPRLGVSRLILTGIAADVCLLFTAADAHMRQYDIWVPADATAGISPERKNWVLDIVRHSMRAETKPTSAFSLQQWISRAS